MLGFSLNIWDYLTFLTFFLATLCVVGFFIWLARLTNRIALLRALGATY